MNKKLLGWSFLHAILAMLYILGVGLFMSHGAQIFGGDDSRSLLVPAAILLLFVISASVMGILILGKPILMYLENKKKDALTMLFYTIGWLAIEFLILLLVSIFVF